jgi:hypothetical protein
MRVLVLIVVMAMAALPASALGDDWVAVKLRGVVLQLVDGDWVKLERGDVVPDDRVIRTMKSGKVQFQRGEEVIDLGTETQVQIVDRKGKTFTTVKQYFGTVGVEADVRNVQHFSVQTPHLAAVVKGTKFIVTSGKSEATVKVTRGRVAVEDEHTGQTVLVAAGQSANVEVGEDLAVAGRGKMPAVYGADGQPVVTERETVAGRSGNGSDGRRGNSVGNTVSGAGNTVGNTVSGVGSTVGDTVGGPVGGAVSGATETVGNTVSSATETVGNTVGGVVSGVGGLVGGLL